LGGLAGALATGRLVGTGFAALGFGTGFFAAGLGRAAGVADLAFGTGFFAAGRAGSFGATFFFAGGLALLPASALPGCFAGFLGFDLRAGFAGFLAMAVLAIRGSTTPEVWGARENLKS
jgi:hypothetical protein